MLGCMSVNCRMNCSNYSSLSWSNSDAGVATWYIIHGKVLINFPDHIVVMWLHGTFALQNILFKATHDIFNIVKLAFQYIYIPSVSVSSCTALCGSFFYRPSKSTFNSDALPSVLLSTKLTLVSFMMKDSIEVNNECNLKFCCITY